MDVARSYYWDSIDHQGAFPTDVKIGLVEMEGKTSRYTAGFGAWASSLCATMTEDDAIKQFKQMHGIVIRKASLMPLIHAVGAQYLPENRTSCDVTNEVETESTVHQTKTACLVPKEANPVVECPLGFLEKRIKEIKDSPDCEKIIENAINGDVEGISYRDTLSTISVSYISADGTGVPGVHKELSENGKNGGRAQTFESKIGVTFQQEFTPQSLPLLNNNEIFRVGNTTKYSGTIEKVDLFAEQMKEFLDANGVIQALQCVFLSDGAFWLANLPARILPVNTPVITIIDKFHAIERMNEMVDKLRFHKTEMKEAYRTQVRYLLDFGKIEEMVASIREKASKLPSTKREWFEKHLEYFERNTEKMRYGLFKAVGLFVGSGVVEAACKTVVAKRMKNSGMHWTKKTAAIIIALRCAILNDTFNYCSGDINDLDFAA